MKQRTRSGLEARFLSKVARGDPTECWEWLGTKNGIGYGMIWDFRGGKWRKTLAHRIAYERHHGVILPAGQRIVIQHTCDNPGCVNPRHLVRGTMLTNAQDMAAKGRRRTVRTANSTNPPHVMGEAHGGSKLTETAVLAIRARLQDGFSLNQTAREFRVAKRTVHRIKHRLSWKHIYAASLPFCRTFTYQRLLRYSGLVMDTITACVPWP